MLVAEVCEPRPLVAVWVYAMTNDDGAVRRYRRCRAASSLLDWPRPNSLTSTWRSSHPAGGIPDERLESTLRRGIAPR